MARLEDAAAAIAAVDQFCGYILTMLEEPAARRRVESLQWANLDHDPRRVPIADPDHYVQTLHRQLATVLGPQRYNLLAEGYYRIDRISGAGGPPKPTPRDPVTPEAVDLAGIRYQYRQAAERDEGRTGQASP